MTTAIVTASLLFTIGALVFVIWNGRQIKRLNAETAATIARTQAILDRMKSEPTP